MKHLTDNELLRQMRSLVQQERELLTQVLDHLHEISDRKLFAELGYKSLLEFAVKHLGYSENQAYRRIAAMKLVQEIPGLEEKIQKGEVHLNHIGLAQNLFRQEAKEAKPFSVQQKTEVINKLVGTSTREAEKITLQMSSNPEFMRPEKVKAINDVAVSLQVTVSNETLTKTETLKGWLAHRFPDLKNGELIEKLCELGMKEWSPSKPASFRATSAAQKAKAANEDPSCKTIEASRSDKPPRQNNEVEPKKSFAAEKDTIRFTERSSANLSDGCNSNNQLNEVCPTKRQSIPKAVRRQIFEKAENRCAKCSSSFFLEIDHRFPFALGGSNDPENLRVLCFNCNQRSAIHAFGTEKIISKVRESLGRSF